jgi:multiple antibiotic resistance protein
MMLSFKEIASVTIILFSIIDIIGSIPVIIDLKIKSGTIQSGKATIVAGVIMFAFLFLGESILKLFGIDVQSFAIAGAIIILLIGFEMILGVTLFKHEKSDPGTTSIVPIAFPLIAGAGTMTTIVSLRAEYAEVNIMLGIIINLALVYLVLKSCVWLEKKIGQGGFIIIRKVMGIILIAIAIKLIKTNLILP